MPIAFTDLEQNVLEALRAQPAFAGWRKKGKRCLWRACGDVQQGVELVRYQSSFENAQWVSLGLYASVPYDKEWPVYVPPEVWNKGRLYRRVYLKPGAGLIEDNSLGGGAVLKITGADELAAWLETLPADVEHHVVPWLRQYRTLEQAQYEYRIPRWRLEAAGLAPDKT